MTGETLDEIVARLEVHEGQAIYLHAKNCPSFCDYACNGKQGNNALLDAFYDVLTLALEREEQPPETKLAQVSRQIWEENTALRAHAAALERLNEINCQEIARQQALVGRLEKVEEAARKRLHHHDGVVHWYNAGGGTPECSLCVALRDLDATR